MDIKHLSNISLDLVGLLALAEISTVARRTTWTGTSTLLDCLVLCPGLHRQQNAIHLHAGEYPICAAMTTNYVFRIENSATVAFLQRIGRAGELTTLTVLPSPEESAVARGLRRLYDYHDAPPLSTVCHFACNGLTLAVLMVAAHLEDWWMVLAITVLILARLINVVVLRRRSMKGWKGASEPDTESDLIVLVSQDKWIRIQGDADDVKAVTSGAWLREATALEDGAIGFATLIVYLNVVTASNASSEGKMLLLILLFASSGLLGLANQCTNVLRMYDRSVMMKEPRKSYKRRLQLTKELIRETGQTDWALKLDMIHKHALPLDDMPGDEVQAGASRGSDGAEEDTKQSKDDQYVIRQL